MKKVIIGAGNTSYEGWIATQEDELDLLNINDYYKLFKEEESIDAFLAEHVFEHLSYDDGIEAGKNLYRFLKKVDMLELQCQMLILIMNGIEICVNQVDQEI